MKLAKFIGSQQPLDLLKDMIPKRVDVLMKNVRKKHPVGIQKGDVIGEALRRSLQCESVDRTD